LQQKYTNGIVISVIETATKTGENAMTRQTVNAIHAAMKMLAESRLDADSHETWEEMYTAECVLLAHMQEAMTSEEFTGYCDEVCAEAIRTGIEHIGANVPAKE
jgi:hypothetical protein